MTSQGDTIFALASARGRAGVSVFRISGPAAHEVGRRLCGDLPRPRRAGLRRLYAGAELIDEALVVIFEAGASFIGEDVVEFQVHGSPAVVRVLTRALSEIGECREAAPGEFTRRALENGRMDLTQVEGLADLIAAETDAQLRQAHRAFEGELGRMVEAWRDVLLRASALVEAAIDFADEELPEEVVPEALTAIQSLLEEWRVEIKGSEVAERVRDGFEVAIVGLPNAGKSTLINAIARRDVAITSARPGTTRDVIEVRVDLGGLPVTFLDTAGMRETGDEVETIGIERTRARAKSADLRLYLDNSAERYDLPVKPGDLRLSGKSDLGEGPGLNVSGTTGAGIDVMLRAVQVELESRASGSGLATRERHRVALIGATTHLEAAADFAERHQVELVADELRAARLRLDALVGRVDVEEILGHIFSAFCIGK